MLKIVFWNFFDRQVTTRPVSDITDVMEHNSSVHFHIIFVRNDDNDGNRRSDFVNDSDRNSTKLLLH